MFKAGYVAIAGRPNAGKSTLLNALVGEKIAIISNKPQTTRNNIIGIKTTDDYQIVFVDTPGIHHTKNHLDKFMMKNVRSALAGVDLIVYLIDGSKTLDEEENGYIEKLKSGECPCIIITTKIDNDQKCSYESDLKISSVSGKNIDILLDKILEKLPSYQKKSYIYDPDMYTDKSIKFLIAEYIREYALKLLNKEIPHGIAVEITKFEEKEGLTVVEADIICEKETHKGIIIGKRGQTLKKIGKGARNESENLLQTKVLLKLFVKVEEDWRNKPNKLNSFGYNDKD